jgi:hypothetical protein
MICSLVFATAALAQPHPQPAPQPVVPPTIVLLDAGDSPRAPLRLKPKIGSGITLELTMHMSQSSKVDAGQATLPNKPAVEVEGVTTIYTIHATVTQIGKGGDIGYEFELIDATVPDIASVPTDVIDTMRQALRTLVGLRGSGIISDRGISKQSRVTLSQKLEPGLEAHVTAIERLMENISPPLPVEPIGPGANWQVERMIVQEVFAVRHTSVFKLTAFDGGTAELTMDIKQHADPQPIDIAGMPGVATSLVSFASSGTARITIQLDQLAPVSSTTTLVNDSTFRARSGQSDQFFSQRIKTTTELAGVIDAIRPATTQPATR